MKYIYESSQIAKSYRNAVLRKRKTTLATLVFVRPSVRPSLRTCLKCVWAITPEPYIIYSWNFTDSQIITGQIVANKEDNSGYFDFRIISRCLKFMLYNTENSLPQALYDTKGTTHPCPMDSFLFSFNRLLITRWSVIFTKSQKR